MVFSLSVERHLRCPDELFIEVGAEITLTEIVKLAGMTPLAPRCPQKRVPPSAHSLSYSYPLKTGCCGVK